MGAVFRRKLCFMYVLKLKQMVGLQGFMLEKPFVNLSLESRLEFTIAQQHPAIRNVLIVREFVKNIVKKIVVNKIAL